MYYSVEENEENTSVCDTSMPYGSLVAFNVVFTIDMIAIAKIKDGGQKSNTAANVIGLNFCDE